MSQAVCSAVELRLAELLANGAQDTADLARATDCDPGALRRLLRALVGLGVCDELGDNRYSITAMGTLLSGDGASSLRSQALWWGRHLWPVWGRLTQSVRTGKSARSLGRVLIATSSTIHRSPRCSTPRWRP